MRGRGTYFERQVVISDALIGGTLERVGAFETEVADVDRFTMTCGEYAHDLRLLPLLCRSLQLR